jgi:hypothetical protein
VRGDHVLLFFLRIALLDLKQAPNSTTPGVVWKKAGGMNFHPTYLLLLQMPCQPVPTIKGIENVVSDWTMHPTLVLSIHVNLMHPHVVFWPLIAPLQGSDCLCKSRVSNSKMVRYMKTILRKKRSRLAQVLEALLISGYGSRGPLCIKYSLPGPIFFPLPPAWVFVS